VGKGVRRPDDAFPIRVRSGLLCIAGGVGAARFVLLASLLGTGWSELTLISGSFCVGFLRRFGIRGTGIGSQLFIGQLLAYNVGANSVDVGTIVLAVALAILASVVPSMLSGPAEQPAIASSCSAMTGDALAASTAFFMGAQAAIASASIVILGHFVWLTESAWAIAACTYVVADSTRGTIDRVCRRIVGTSIGVPLALALLPFAAQAPLELWFAAATAMVIYAIALPEHYDIASGAYAFALIVTLAASGEHSVGILLARLWETVIGGALGLTVLLLLAPIPHWKRRNAARAE
jgi:hypothetical protein